EHTTLRLAARAGAARRAGAPGGGGDEPGVKRRRVVTVRPGRAGNLPARVLHGHPGPNGRIDRAEVAADVPDELGQRPSGAGRHGHRQVSAPQDVSEQVSLGDDLVAVAAVRQDWHGDAMILASPDDPAPRPDNPPSVVPRAI